VFNQPITAGRGVASNPNAEAHKPIHLIGGGAGRTVRSPEGLSAQRAVEVLERIGTPAALELLDQYGRGAPGARLTQHAQDAGRRVRARLGLKTP
jgi:hypothetical protein